MEIPYTIGGINLDVRNVHHCRMGNLILLVIITDMYLLARRNKNKYTMME